MTEYKVALEVYSGPLDLLLFLIRREEVDIYDIPIARITEQYLEYVEVLRQLDPETVSEFLVLAATLMEIKSRTLLPRPTVADAEDEEIVDPRLELVRQLLEYRKFKDAARSLEDSAHLQGLKHARSPVLPLRSPDELELDEVDIWDLVDAFKRVLEQIGKTGQVHEVGVDDTPLALHAEDILDSVEGAGGMQRFEDIFTGRIRAEMIGLFIALLELIRQRRVRVSQDKPFGVILIHLLDRTPLDTSAEDDSEAFDDELDGSMSLKRDGEEPTRASDKADAGPAVASDGNVGEVAEAAPGPAELARPEVIPTSVESPASPPQHKERSNETE